ncbi:KilA-N domain-containing protein [Cobetia sp. 1AS1]|uniref:KilA-N domain-containing protein n=1 Tax=Cobetia sp. 1AS1 TaxID=3040016 RepID=UPI00244BEB80|nr:KilA-N domain-containing protein [Cobetia sp. 1AS1]MDH2293199.1 KilA-N domain-containing protein [Cobetia sp. 1AS1]
MTNVIPLDYEGQSIRFNTDGWINATDIAKRFHKRPVDWLKQDETQAYLREFAAALNCDPESLLKTRRGRYDSGTWLHPKLGVRFAQWLDVRFAVWCDLRIDAFMRGELSAMQEFEKACCALDDQNAKGSLAGRELASHRWIKPALESRADYWRQELQMALPIDS